MNKSSTWTMVLALLAATAHGQVPASNDISDGNGNTGMGITALGGPAASNAGSNNTASGEAALQFFTTGTNNTAAGFAALQYSITGDYNTADGALALRTTSGSNNTATGANALEGPLFGNNTGDYNTATGSSALQSNTTGYSNTAAGFQALLSNTGGYSNTASGVNALYSNTAGIDNTASGQDALFSNSTGNDNTATGVQALNLATGSGNVALGFQAGLNVTTGSSNIEIGNAGAAADNKVIKIGTEGTHKKTYIAGIFSNTAVSGLTVVVGSNGELGAVSSSERFKTDIAPMGSNTEKLQRLRPVTFHYKADAQGPRRYGLIAEEVAGVYPELVVHDNQGRIDGVRYDELAPMLLNEMQKEHSTVASLVAQQEADAAKIEQQAAIIDKQGVKIASLERKVAEVDDLKQQLSAVIKQQKAQDTFPSPTSTRVGASKSSL